MNIATFVGWNSRKVRDRETRSPTRGTRALPNPSRRPRLQLLAESLDHFLHAADDKRKTIVIEFVRCVGGAVIIRVTKWRGIGDHDAGIAVLPKSPLIRPTDARNERWKSGAFGRNSCMFTKKSDGTAQERA